MPKICRETMSSDHPRSSKLVKILDPRMTLSILPLNLSYLGMYVFIYLFRTHRERTQTARERASKWQSSEKLRKVENHIRPGENLPHPLFSRLLSCIDGAPLCCAFAILFFFYVILKDVLKLSLFFFLSYPCKKLCKV